MRQAVAYAIGFSVVMALPVQPAIAQDRVRVTDHLQANVQHESAAFGGLTFRLPVGGSAVHKPSLRLQATRTSSFVDVQQGPTLHEDWSTALEIGFDKKPIVLVSGRNVADVQRDLAVQGDTRTAIGILAVVALVGLLVVAMKGAAATAAYR